MSSCKKLACIAFCLVCGVISANAVVAQQLPEAVAVEGQPFKARLRSLDAAGDLTFESRGGEAKKLPLADLCWWGTWAEAPAETQVVLVDGSLLMADVTALNKEPVVLESTAAGTLKLPLENVAGIVLAPPADRQRADLLRFGLLKPGGDADRLTLDNGDELTGEVTGLAENTLKIRTAAGEVSVARDKIAVLAFNPSLAAKPHRSDAKAWVGLADGSRLLVTSLTVERSEVQFTLLAGPTLTCKLDDLVALQPLGGRATWLSDLKPASYQQIPFLNLSWPYYADRNVLGGQLRAGGRLYLKGLGLHTAARLTYDLDRPCKSFAAEAAIDDQTAGRGSAVFRVYTDDGSGKWQLRYDSPIVRGGAAPLGVAVELTGVKRISLLVDFADQGDELAHADWLNARLLR